jgi:hypothetical protein
MDGRTGALLVACLLAGCGQRGTTIVTTKSSPGSATVDPAASAAALTAAKEFVAAAKAGQATAESLTTDFKKIVGEPLSPSERERGYSDSSATEWLHVVGPRLTSANVTASFGPASLTFQLEQGLIRLVNEDRSWKVDWFHAGSPPQGMTAFRTDDASKYLAVRAFLDPLFTNNWELCEAALSDDAKKSLAPALGADPRGYNRGTLRSKVRGLLNGAKGYAVALSGDLAVVSLTGAAERKLTLALSESPRPGVWLVSGID